LCVTLGDWFTSGEGKQTTLEMAAKVFDEFPSFNSHPLVFIKELIRSCSVTVTQVSCTEDVNSSFVETHDFRLPQQCE
jgi:hypothetical protein